jgi:ubiquitin-protein ligase E3 A
MKEGLDVLRMLFYANLLSGQRDTLEIIETERENDEKMEIELVNRRQRLNDNTGNNEEPQPSGETRSEASTASTAGGEGRNDRPRNSRTRRSTNEPDENESPFENALQTKLGLKRNEYRHGRYPFDDFVNEYANEKIEIRKEYLDYIQRSTSTIKFSFIFYPFFLSTINKIGKIFIYKFLIFEYFFFNLALLSIETKARMHFQRRSIFVHNIFSPIRLNPFFKLYVRRNHLIEDALISVC